MSNETEKTRLEQALTQLKAERAAVEEAIAVLRRIKLNRGKRPGRPPAWMNEATAAPKRRRLLSGPTINRKG
jgi:hypothetical protein